MAYIQTAEHYPVLIQTKESYDELRKLLATPAPPGFIIVNTYTPEQQILVGINQIVTVKENL